VCITSDNRDDNRDYVQERLLELCVLVEPSQLCSRTQVGTPLVAYHTARTCKNVHAHLVLIGLYGHDCSAGFGLDDFPYCNQCLQVRTCLYKTLFP